MVVQGEGSGWVSQKMAHMRLVHIGEMFDQDLCTGLERARKHCVSASSQTSAGIAEEIYGRRGNPFAVLLGEFSHWVRFYGKGQEGLGHEKGDRITILVNIVLKQTSGVKGHFGTDYGGHGPFQFYGHKKPLLLI
jgi:hypothetical protein